MLISFMQNSVNRQQWSFVTIGWTLEMNCSVPTLPTLSTLPTLVAKKIKPKMSDNSLIFEKQFIENMF